MSKDNYPKFFDYSDVKYVIALEGHENIFAYLESVTEIKDFHLKYYMNQRKKVKGLQNFSNDLKVQLPEKITQDDVDHVGIPQTTFSLFDKVQILHNIIRSALPTDMEQIISTRRTHNLFIGDIATVKTFLMNSGARQNNTLLNKAFSIIKEMESKKQMNKEITDPFALLVIIDSSDIDKDDGSKTLEDIFDKINASASNIGKEQPQTITSSIISKLNKLGNDKNVIYTYATGIIKQIEANILELHNTLERITYAKNPQNSRG